MARHSAWRRTSASPTPPRTRSSRNPAAVSSASARPSGEVSTMKIAIMGSGAIGGYFGGRLAANGEDVTFIARGAHLAAIKANGLKLESGLGDVTIKPAEATDDPKSIGPVDYVLFCVKLYDVEAAGAQIKPLIGPQTTV